METTMEMRKWKRGISVCFNTRFHPRFHGNDNGNITSSFPFSITSLSLERGYGNEGRNIKAAEARTNLFYCGRSYIIL